MISVIIPVYNVKPYLERCVRSVCGQSFTDTEILLIDDGSTDGSGALCDALAARDERIGVLHQPNGGLSAARNAGLGAVHGDRIAFVDSDDCPAPDMLQTLADVMQEQNCDIVSCASLSFTGELPVPPASSGAVRVFDRESALRELVLGKTFGETVWNKLYSRSAVETLRFPEGRWHEDIFFTYRAFLRAERIAAVDYTGYFYFQRADSIMGERFSAKRLDALEGMAERAEVFRRQAPSVYADACLSLARNCMYQYQRFLEDGDPDGENRKKAAALFESVYPALRPAGARERLWLTAFHRSPEKTSRLRSRMRVGY